MWRPLTLFLIVLVSASAYADRGDVTLFAGAVAGGSFEGADNTADLDIDNAPGFGAAWHLNAASGGQYELFYLRQQTDFGINQAFQVGDEVDLTIEYFQLGGNYGFEGYGDDQWQPYALLTVGAARYSPDAPDTESEVFFAMTGGLGLRRLVSERLSIRFEARAMATFVNDDTDIFCVSSGGAICAISVEGDTVLQWTAFAAVGYRF